VRVTGEDFERLGDLATALTGWEENRAYMRMIDGHCAALLVSSDDKTFTCSIYDRRPAICRELVRGSRACLGERDQKAERALIALGRAKPAD